jgi:hypothetical protein
MRPNPASEIYAGDYLAGSDIHHNHIAAICSRLTDTRVSVDWHEGQASVGGRRQFVSSRAPLVNNRDLLTRLRINNADRAILLIGDKQHYL